MRNLLLLISLLLFAFPFYGYAQDLPPAQKLSPFHLSSHFPHPQNINWSTNRYQSHLDVNSHYFYNSNTLPLSVNNDVLFEEALDNGSKEDALRNLEEENLFEADFGVNITYSHLLDSSSLLGEAIVYGGLRHNNLTFGNINRDAIQLLLLGNAHFEGETARLSDMDFQRYVYHSFDLGIRKRWAVNKHNFEVGVGASLLQGSVNWDAEVDSAQVFTATDGEFIDANYAYSIYQTNQGSPEIFKLNGIGFSGDLSLVYRYGKKVQVRLSARDLGFINWSDETFFYQQDTAVNFQGVEVPDIFSGQSPVNENLTDSLSANFDPFIDNRSYTTTLPATIEASVAVSFLGGSLSVMPGFRYRLLPGYQPHIFLKSSYFLPDMWGFSLYSSYGGYGSYNVGMEAVKRIGPIEAVIGSHSVQGFLAPETASGASLYVRLGYSF